MRSGAIDVRGLRARVAALRCARPATVLATSFALVHFLDALGTGALPLPPGSRIMQTGGYKGKSRVLSPTALRQAVARAFGVELRAIVSEYGMTELSSQFWEATLVDPNARPGVYREPPWARVVPVDPETLRPVPPGVEGVARIEDLANVDSAFAVLAQDQSVASMAASNCSAECRGPPREAARLLSTRFSVPIRAAHDAASGRPTRGHETCSKTARSIYASRERFADALAEGTGLSRQGILLGIRISGAQRVGGGTERARGAHADNRARTRHPRRQRVRSTVASDRDCARRRAPGDGYGLRV